MNEQDVNSPFIERGKSMLEQVLRIAQTRLEMLSVEVQREKLELARIFKLAAAVAVCAWLAGFALILWVALSLPPDVRSIMLGGLFIVLLAATIVCALALKRKAQREPIFSRVIEQLKQDRASLGTET
jgi:uncharacterized membrane protein YqjE